MTPVRKLTVPHQSWGLSLDLKNDELAVTSQQYQGISIYKRTASKTDRPLRTIRGDKTHARRSARRVPRCRRATRCSPPITATGPRCARYSADGPPLLVGEYVPGRFEKPSIRVYKASLDGNVPPIRTIQGTEHEAGVADGADGRRRGRRAGGRQLRHQRDPHLQQVGQRRRGARRASSAATRPASSGRSRSQIDRKNNEMWVANYGDHTAVVFDRTASGNVAPKRIIRNAPAGTPTTGFTNASAAAYDSKRDQLLVPN